MQKKIIFLIFYFVLTNSTEFFAMLPNVPPETKRNRVCKTATLAVAGILSVLGFWLSPCDCDESNNIDPRYFFGSVAVVCIAGMGSDVAQSIKENCSNG